MTNGNVATIKRLLGFAALILAVASFVGLGPTLLAVAIVALALAILL
jgi:hypothetical protein